MSNKQTYKIRKTTSEKNTHKNTKAKLRTCDKNPASSHMYVGSPALDNNSVEKGGTRPHVGCSSSQTKPTKKEASAVLYHVASSPEGASN